jgi:hypothetical protein
MDSSLIKPNPTGLSFRQKNAITDKNLSTIENDPSGGVNGTKKQRAD